LCFSIVEIQSRAPRCPARRPLAFAPTHDSNCASMRSNQFAGNNPCRKPVCTALCLSIPPAPDGFKRARCSGRSGISLEIIADVPDPFGGAVARLVALGPASVTGKQGQLPVSEDPGNVLPGCERSYMRARSLGTAPARQTLERFSSLGPLIKGPCQRRCHRAILIRFSRSCHAGIAC
jgi:hypothetical protein